MPSLFLLSIFRVFYRTYIATLKKYVRRFKCICVVFSSVNIFMFGEVFSVANMSDEFQDTPTAESKASTLKSTGANEIKLPWGRLYATVKNLDSLGKQKTTIITYIVFGPK